MQTKWVYFSIIFLIAGLPAFAQSSHSLKVGAERLEVLLPLLEGKKVGLVANQTSYLESRNMHVLDVLVENKADVRAIFAPEHGFRGTAEAGAEIDDTKDARTGIPVYSIYGRTRKPSAEQLADIDVVIFDMQDVGTRFYTYISTMHYVMEGCAENGKEVIVLDRPNPNDFVDGPILEPKYRSFVGMHQIPVLHGLTVGELAQMINGEGWLKDSMQCKLTVVPVVHWKHGESYWLVIKPSPNLPNNEAILLYPSLCFFEGTAISVGRGTYFPFQVLGCPDKRFGDFTFTPTSLPGFDANPMYKDQLCYGEDLRQLPFGGGLTLKFILDFYEKSGHDAHFFFKRANWFDQLAGTDKLRQQIIAGMTEEEIRLMWQDDLDKYKEMRKKYLLYDDY